MPVMYAVYILLYVVTSFWEVSWALFFFNRFQIDLLVFGLKTVK